MKKQTILDYLDQQLEKKITEFDTAIDWDTRNHTIELVVRLFAENKSGERIDDAQGVVSESEIIEFEDGLLFYNTQKVKQIPDASDYMAVIPFDGKKGMSKGEIDGALTYLNEVLINGQDSLLEFLTDGDKETFELVWNDDEFKKAIKEASTATDSYFPYPSY
ncbi:DUF3013 family protein [Enterococcus sp. LJL128]